YAQRFGSLPIATRTGGLADTIDDGINGFLFETPSRESYLNAIRRAFNVHQRSALLNAMRRSAMATPSCWDKSAKPYDELYQQLVDGKAGVVAAHQNH